MERAVGRWMGRADGVRVRIVWDGMVRVEVVVGQWPCITFIRKNIFVR